MRATPRRTGETVQDLAILCAESGTVLLLTGLSPASSRGMRMVVFLASGDTYWFESPSPRAFDLVQWQTSGHERMRLACRVAPVGEHVELRQDVVTAVDPRVPLSLDVAFAPTSPAVSLRNANASDQIGATTQYCRVSGFLALGSVTYHLGGQAWWTTRSATSEHDQCGVRLHAAFQDGSGLVATGGPSDGHDQLTAAALQVGTTSTACSVHRLAVDGPERGPAHRVSCALDGRPPVSAAGQIRNIDQHVAFVRPASVGGWLRVGYTPVDVVRSGVTGLGAVEQVVRVPTASPLRGTHVDLPDPY